MRWGLVPYWAKDLKVGFANINAKAEGIAAVALERLAKSGLTLFGLLTALTLMAMGL